MAKYLVTGAAGFIAGKVCELLLAQGHEVVGVDNLNDAYDVRLKHWRLEQIQNHPAFEFHQMDISRRKGLDELFSSPFEGVIHLAARAGVRQSLENPWVYIDTNITGTLNVLELCREFGVKKFVLASTSSIYGASPDQPFREDGESNSPLSPYAASKKGAEALSYSYHHLYGIDVTVVRYFTVYGPAGRPDMSIFRFVQQISEERQITVFGDGQQSRDFTYVHDIADGTIRALKPLGFEIINLGSDQPVKLIDTIRLSEEMLGKKAVLDFKARHPADVMATWADVGKAGKLLRWKASYNFEKGLAAVVDWYRTNRSWAKDIAID